MTHSTILLAQLLSCGYADITFFESEMDDFGVEVDDLDVQDWQDNYGTAPSLNDLLGKMYEVVCERHNISEDRYSIFTNCLDSHLHIDGEEMYSEADVKGRADVESEEE